MFSVGTGLQLVFADENDSYFTQSLLRLNLHQFLWLSLREQYSAVCFLRASEDDKGFSIHTFGDCNKILPSDWLHGAQQTLSSAGKAQKCFQKWLKGKTAIVCPALDFYKVMSRANWKECFDKIVKLIHAPSGNGALVLTASCYAEDNMQWQHKDSILAQEAFCVALRKTILNHETYEYLQQSMPGRCTFLSAYSMETVYPIVLRAAMGKPERLEQLDDLERISACLIAACSGNGTRRAPGNIGGRITFAALYQALLRDSFWDELARESAGGANQSVKGRAMFHVAHSYAAKCAELPLPKALEEDGATAQAIRHIGAVVCNPYCCAENQSIVTELEALLDRALRQWKAKDINTYKICIQAIDFAIGHVHDWQEDIVENVINIIKSYQTYINLSDQYEKARKLEAKTVAQSRLGLEVRKRITAQLEVLPKQMNQCQDAILAMTVKLSTVEIAELPNQVPDILNAALDEMQEEKPEKTDSTNTAEDVYIIRDTDFDF